MNGQCQEIPAVRMSIPEDRKQQIIVVLGQMMGHSLAETSSQGEKRTRKDREHSTDDAARVICSEEALMLKLFGRPFSLGC